MPQNSIQTLARKAAKRAKIAIEKSLTSLDSFDKRFGSVVNNNTLARGIFSLIDLLLDPTAIITAAVGAVLVYIASISLNVLLSAGINTAVPLLVFAVAWASTLLFRGLRYLLFKR